MLLQAAKACIPLIYVTSEDPMNDHVVLENLLDAKVKYLDRDLTSGDDYYYVRGDTKEDFDFPELYKRAEEHHTILIIINGEFSPEMMDCGRLVPDSKSIKKLLPNIILKKNLPEVVDLLEGMFIKDIRRVISFCGVVEKSLTVASIRKVRDQLYLHITGITPVEVGSTFFFPMSQEIMDWSQLNKEYMFANVDQRLVPRGVLLWGVPGTGKTELAKYLARDWDLPLFLLDINSMLTKWQGEAEGYLERALTALNERSPCIVLFDEVEKLFHTTSDSETSKRLLSKILWWLQSKESNVFVVMTCNNVDEVPPELRRKGRVSDDFELKGLLREDVGSFVKALVESFSMGKKKKILITTHVKSCIDEGTEWITQADVTQLVINYLKQRKFGL